MSASSLVGLLPPLARVSQVGRFCDHAATIGLALAPREWMCKDSRAAHLAAHAVIEARRPRAA